MLQEKQFYIFWMILHRRHTLRFDASLGEDSPYREIMRQHPELLAITANLAPGLLELPGYTISNMNIEVEIHDRIH